MSDLDKLINSINKSMTAPKPKYCGDCVHFHAGKCFHEYENAVVVAATFSCANFERVKVHGAVSAGGDLDTRQNWNFWTRVKSGW